MKLLSLLLSATLFAASAELYNYGLAGIESCVLVNIVMDESGSMLTEQLWMKENALPTIAAKLEMPEYGYDRVFLCANGYGLDSSEDPASVDDHGFRHMGCSEGYDAGILDWQTSTNNDLEDSYHAIIKAIDNVDAVINGVDLAATCGRMDKNIILVTDEDRDEVDDQIDITTVRQKVADNEYILNLVVNVAIGVAEEQNIGARFNYDPADYPAIVPPIFSNENGLFYIKTNEDYPNEVFAPDLDPNSEDYWFLRAPVDTDVDYWLRENQYVYDSTYLGLITSLTGQSDEHYVGLITNTRGAIWSIQVLEDGKDQLEGGNPRLSDSFVNAFIDVKVDEICPDPPCRAIEMGDDDDEGETGGDPHITTWKGEHYEYHGQCDLVLVKDAEFANGLGLDVHIRTKIVRFWSYIKNVAIRIGNDILEIEGSADIEDNQSKYWINYEYQGELNEFAGFPVTVTVLAAYKRVYEIDLHSKFPGRSISIHIYKEFVRVKFKGGKSSFGNTVGLLGDFNTGKTLARDGSTILDDFTELGNEWQVLPSETKLFHEVSHPQFPEKCIEPEDPRGERRRRLDENTVTEEQAEAACASLKDALSRKDCVYDILATQDIDMIGAF